MKNINIGKALLRIKKNLTVVAVVVLTLAFWIINPNFLGSMNLDNLMTDASTILIMSIGVTFPILLGSMDLSTGSLCSLMCAITGTLFARFGNLSLLFAVLIGIAAGLLNGLVYSTFKIPGFIATLCTGSIFTCLALIVSGGAAKSIDMGLWKTFDWIKFKPVGIPIYFIISIVLLVLLFFIQKYTVLGKSICATGANELGARNMGINTRLSKVMCFTISGVCSAICGALLALKLKSNSPTAGDSMSLLAIAAVALGGTPLSGGRGSVLKTLVGVLLVTVLKNAINLFGIDAYWTDILFGVMIIVAVGLTSEKDKRVLVK